MIKILKKSLINFYRKFYRKVMFDEHDRKEFLEILLIQIEMNLPLAQILQNIGRTGSTDQIKALAMQSLHDLTTYNDCTKGWEKYYPPADTLVLRNAFKQDNIQSGINLVMHGKQESVTFYDAVIKSNSQYFIFVIGLLAMLYILSMERATLEAFNTDMLLFKYFEWFAKWTVPIIFTYILLYIVYYFNRGLLRGTPRHFAYKLGLYLAYDRLVAYQFCIIARDGLKNGMNMADIILLSEGVFTERRQAYGLYLVRQRLTDGFAIAVALKHALFEPMFSDYLLSLAPSEGRVQLTEAFDRVAKILNTRVESQFRQIGYYLMSVLMLIAGALFFPILELMTGAALPAS